jgi:hypothetical protein
LTRTRRRPVHSFDSKVARRAAAVTSRGIRAMPTPSATRRSPSGQMDGRSTSPATNAPVPLSSSTSPAAVRRRRRRARAAMSTVVMFGSAIGCGDALVRRRRSGSRSHARSDRPPIYATAAPSVPSAVPAASHGAPRLRSFVGPGGALAAWIITSRRVNSCRLPMLWPLGG